MGLGLAGAISGMGQGLGQGLQTLNSGLVQMGVNQSLAKNDREFQMEKLKLQQDFERGMQSTKIAADKENSLAQIAATGENTRALENLRAGHMKDLEGMKEGAADKRLDKQLGAQKEIEIMKADLTRDVHEMDNKALTERYKQYYQIHKDDLDFKKRQVHTLPTGDGRIALYTADGKPHGYLTDSKGNEIKAPVDIPKSALTEINALTGELHDASKEYAKQPYHTEEQEDAYKTLKSSIQEKIDRLVAPYKHGGGTVLAPEPKPEFNPGKYKDFKPGMAAPPAPGPTSSAAPPDTSRGLARTLIPGYGLGERLYNALTK